MLPPDELRRSLLSKPPKTVFNPDEVVRMAVACKAATDEQPCLNANEVAKRVLVSASLGAEAAAQLKDAGLRVPFEAQPSRRTLLRLW